MPKLTQGYARIHLHFSLSKPGLEQKKTFMMWSDMVNRKKISSSQFFSWNYNF